MSKPEFGEPLAFNAEKGRVDVATGEAVITASATGMGKTASYAIMWKVDLTQRMVDCTNALAGLDPEALPELMSAADRGYRDLDAMLAGDFETLIRVASELRSALRKLRKESP